jgi:ATPase family protein associated with various cellular activities (AAA)/winged helix domain-containing protein
VAEILVTGVRSGTLAIEHLLLRLRPLRRALRAAARRQTDVARRLLRPNVSALCVTSDQVETLLDDLDAPAAIWGAAAEPTPEETAEEASLRFLAAESGTALPLDALAARLDFTPFETDAVVLCAAPEIDRAYERIIAYVLDDLNRRQPCIELLTSLTASSLGERLARRQLLGPYGRLRRCGVLELGQAAATESRQELRLTPPARAFVLGSGADIASAFADPAEVTVPDANVTSPSLFADAAARLGRAVAARELSTVGVWGPRHAGRDDAVYAITRAAGRSLRRISLGAAAGAANEVAAAAREAALAAAALRAVLWVELDAPGDEGRTVWEEPAAHALAASPAPLVITGANPWRPWVLLEARTYAEIEVASAGLDSRRRQWSSAFPELEAERIGALATRFRLSGSEIGTVERLARASARLAGNGRPAPVEQHLEAACRAVTQRRAAHFATLVRPRRGPADLILPTELHRQVLDIAGFFRVRPQVEEEWGFGSGGGSRALFTGEPGTGKTLAAEVVSGLLGLPMLKVDLARIVSKWVGETEKNLESVFSEAEESHSVLFFDEADGLFSKRGEVQHGTDRYANLEVSYLLQKLEDHRGIVVLASNLRDQIDSAFTRRFDVTVHFPRPALAERRRIWAIAFPSSAPLDPAVDLDVLTRLDLTGAGIAGIARTAALIAADARAPFIGVAHIVQAAVRQYRREARILAASELGPYGGVLKGGT